MVEIVLILAALAFYSWRLWVFANVFGKKQPIRIIKYHKEHQEEIMKPVKRYSIHKNIYE